MPLGQGNQVSNVLYIIQHINVTVSSRARCGEWCDSKCSDTVRVYVFQGPFTRITFRQDLYLGGYRNNSLIAPRTGSKWGFVGCVRSLTLNNRRYDMRKGTFVGDALRGLDVGGSSTKSESQFHLFDLQLKTVLISIRYSSAHSELYVDRGALLRPGTGHYCRSHPNVYVKDENRNCRVITNTVCVQLLQCE